MICVSGVGAYLVVITELLHRAKILSVNYKEFGYMSVYARVSVAVLPYQADEIISKLLILIQSTKTYGHSSRTRRKISSYCLFTNIHAKTFPIL